jgi:hypothetical protein
MAGYLMIFGFQNENIYAISGKWWLTIGLSNRSWWLPLEKSARATCEDQPLMQIGILKVWLLYLLLLRGINLNLGSQTWPNYLGKL